MRHITFGVFASALRASLVRQPDVNGVDTAPKTTRQFSAVRFPFIIINYAGQNSPTIGVRRAQAPFMFIRRRVCSLAGTIRWAAGRKQSLFLRSLATSMGEEAVLFLYHQHCWYCGDLQLVKTLQHLSA
jgi:hypothetical protein